ncbi:hypothetical protein [Corynebacterium glucuronolyticum]|uniref:DNA-binding transcriptional regulator of glucitol operon n=2 Tax=Corynebacterium glucuronolyticum TaxID=39791 RepID=A0AAX1L6Q3_9CORY|nr:hypothetical protein [Corynebacterium glucuronolyticum]EEI62423.1 hypothetical protein HMPREF0293_2144 [Corynebacterium glucuronolyticum ATCC 51866]QRP70095.1 hypothetical protein I6J21_09970 [Corynebacterium glucuronolyticum]
MTGKKKFKVRFSHILLLTLGVAFTLVAAYWQWQRYTSPDGSVQNLGYAIQWPIFGGFLVFFYLKVRDYENDRLNEDESSQELEQLEEENSEKKGKKKVTTVSSEWMPSPVNTDIEAYNEKFAPRRRKDRHDGDD